MIELFASLELAGALFVAVAALEALAEFVGRKIREAGISEAESREPMAGYRPTDEDLALAGRSRDLLERLLPGGLDELAAMDLDRRQQFVAALARETCELYEVDIRTLQFLPGEEMNHAFGACDARNGVLMFNIDALGSTRSDLLWMMVDTVFHECRHALQHAAVCRSSCRYGSAEQRLSWAVNLLDGNYAEPRLEGFESYRKQPVEFDAENFARTVLRGFH